MGLPSPPQLKAALMLFAQKLTFSWSIPRHLQVHGLCQGMWNGSMRDVIWDIGAIASAFSNFNNWREGLGSPNARADEAANAPEM